MTENFTPTTDEVWRLQRGSDPESASFQEMAEHGHYGGRPGATRQGIYVCSPSGRFLASINSTNADRVIEMMERGLKTWQKLPEVERRLSPDSQIRPEHRWEDSFPSDGLVLNVVTRDLPLNCDPTAPCEVKWNQDHAWFSKQEARMWLGVDPSEGDIHQLPEVLVSRLARLHFVDTVKGQSSRFSRSGVSGSWISTEVVDRTDSLVKLKVVGSTKGATAAGWWRESSNGVVTRLLGHATFDVDREKFVEFELVAIGRRWGSTRLNGRRRDAEEGPLGFVFRLPPANAVPIAPTFIASYDADWVIRPPER
jgi:hypothetical protein